MISSVLFILALHNEEDRFVIFYGFDYGFNCAFDEGFDCASRFENYFYSIC